jgi:hypothetical protein
MKVLYRISDGLTKPNKFPHASKKYCLENFLLHFPKDEVIIYADNVTDDSYEWVSQLGCEVHRTNGGNSAAGFRIVFEAALNFGDDEIIYFVEDDYLHLPNSRTVLLEGLERTDYVSLYDHLDKYLTPSYGGNPFIGDDCAEETKVFVTPHSHWKLTNSTTMTFASTVKTLREDAEVWRTHSTGVCPRDFQAFLDLRERGRTLATPLPGYSTHCDPQFPSPLTDWSAV